MSIDPTMPHKDGTNIQSARSNICRGQTIVKHKALVRVAGQVTADTLGINANNVKVSIHDDGTRLGLALETPLSNTDMTRCTSTPDVTVFSLCESARKRISQRVAHITGHSIGNINVVIAGIEKDRTKNRRVE